MSFAEAVGKGDEDGVSRATLLWRAAKLPIYSVALVPLSVGSGFLGFDFALGEYQSDVKISFLSLVMVKVGFFFLFLLVQRR